MYSVLVNALLLNCPDPDIVLNTLCWPSDTWPETERVEALTVLLEKTSKLPDYHESEDGKFGANNISDIGLKKTRILNKVGDITWNLCLPLLFKISSESGSGEPSDHAAVMNKELLNAVYGLLSVCVGSCDGEVPERLANITIPVLQLPEGEPGGEIPSKEELNVDIAIEILAIVIPALSTNEKLTARILSSAFTCIKTSSDALASKILVRVVFTLLDNCIGGERETDTLGNLWAYFCSWHESDSTPAVTARTLLCLTALSDYLFPASKPTTQSNVSIARNDPRLSQQFWGILQMGLTHRDAVSRKRALYLLKRCVVMSEDGKAAFRSGTETAEDHSMFRWVPDKSQVLREFWVKYSLIMETLDENQIHVVRPVLNRMNSLIEATAGDSQDGPLLHPSWLLCVFQRMFHSENKAVMREGVSQLMGLGVIQLPVFTLAFAPFIVGPFLDVLAESSLFHRSPGQRIGECPELGTKLQDFMVAFFSSLSQENRGEVLLQLVQRLGSRHWCAVPILFLSQALSRLPPGPVLGPAGLQAFREILGCTMITHQVLLRGAAQCFLLYSALCLTDVTAVTLDDVFGFLSHFREDESLCRGTALWDRLCDWLLQSEGRFKHAVRDPGAPQEPRTGSPKRESVWGFVQSQLHSFLRVPACTDPVSSLPNPCEADLLARSVLLAADMGTRKEVTGETLCGALEELLCPLLDTLRRLNTNVYLPLRKTDKSLQLLLAILRLRGGERPGRNPETRTVDNVSVTIQTSVLAVAEPIQEFLLRRLSGELCELCDVDRARLYHAVLRELVQLYDAVGWHRTNRLGSFVPPLVRHCLRSLEKPPEQNPSLCGQVSRAIDMASLVLLCELGEKHQSDLHPDASGALLSVATSFLSSPAHLNITLHKPAVTTRGLEGVPEESLSLQGWGRVAARFVRDRWNCLHFALVCHSSDRPPEAPPAPATLGAAVEALAVLPSDLVLPVLDCMTTVLPQVVESNESLCVEALTLAWKVVLGLSTNPHDFWPALEGFVRLAFDHSLLELTNTQAPSVADTVQQMASALMELSQTKTGVFTVLIRHCCLSWLTSAPREDGLEDRRISSTLRHLDVLAGACVHGPVFRRDQRLIQEVQTYVEQLGEDCAANCVVTSDCRDDQFPRIFALAFVGRLDSSNPLHQRVMEELVLSLLRKDEEISKSKVRYYSNSLQHRVKNRVWQTLLVLLPKLREEFVETVLDRVYKAGFCSNQASVKYLIQWMMILTLYWHPAFIDSFWACFSVDQEKTKTSVCTFLSVLVHLNIILPEVQDKALQLRKALDVVLQWCFCHNFSVRLYALLALKRVWGLEGVGAASADGLGGLAAVVRACLHQAEVMQRAGNAMKNWTRIQDHFFFGTFHPLKDYSIETIFHTFPCLSELAEDEWIPPRKFERLVEFTQNPLLPLRNPGRALAELQPGNWVQQEKGEMEQEERWVEVQKKVTPWRLSVADQDPALQLAPQQRAARLGKLHSALLVVASLIDKPTNLGGLCRTCEIFGASALVLDSLHHVRDRNFQALSVSAELWLPLLEVKPKELPDFLQAKKREGYCIVGVEQTANSQSLQDYTFPGKTLLLLGNEREGIPANLLQLLDVCVEIPQHGITRSLNVHVSAALLVWEYTRQHLNPREPTLTSDL